MPLVPLVQLVDTRQNVDKKALVALAVDSQTPEKMNVVEATNPQTTT